MMTLAAVLCCSLTTMVFLSCEKEETHSTTYTYELEPIREVNNTDNEYNIIRDALRAALGYEYTSSGISLPIHKSKDDDQIKALCEEVRARYANAKSTLLMYAIFRVTDNSDPDVARTRETIGFVAVGQGLDKPFNKFTLIDNEREFINQMNAIRDSIGEELYRSSRLGYKRIHNDYALTLKNYLNKFINDSADVSQTRVLHICDSLINLHTSDTLAVPAHFSVSKTILLTDETSEIWSHTFPATL